MAPEEQQQYPAGWYPDPDGSGGQRYYDGQAWTDSRMPPPGPPGSPPPGGSYGGVQAPQMGTMQPGTQPVQAKTNGMAIASLVLGLVWLYWVGSVLAIIFGLIAKKSIDESGGLETGRGMAIAGIVLGIVGLAFLLLIIIVALASPDAFDEYGY